LTSFVVVVHVQRDHHERVGVLAGLLAAFAELDAEIAVTSQVDVVSRFRSGYFSVLDG